MNCPLCASVHVEAFLVRDDVPVHQNLLFDSAEAARFSARGQLRMTVCVSCGFVFNGAFDAGRITYGRGYDNDQTFSIYFDQYVESLVDELAAHVGIDGKMIAEIGCGTGYFLRRVVDAAKDSRGIGYDPSYIGPATSDDGRIEFVPTTFARETGGRSADIVICRHVIEHLPDPPALVSALRGRLSPQAVVVFETPCVEWILRHGVVWDFFYEHCSLFSAASLAGLFERSGFDVQRVSHVFNDQYLWLAARPGEAAAEDRRDTEQLVGECRRFGDLERRTVSRWRESVETAAARGGVAVWGAGAKGATFVNLVDPDAGLVTCLVDVNPRKQGRFVAGTGHAVAAPDQLTARGVATVIIMNPNYETEIRSIAGRTAPRLEFVAP